MPVKHIEFESNMSMILTYKHDLSTLKGLPYFDFGWRSGISRSALFPRIRKKIRCKTWTVTELNNLSPVEIDFFLSGGTGINLTPPPLSIIRFDVPFLVVFFIYLSITAATVIFCTLCNICP